MFKLKCYLLFGISLFVKEVHDGRLARRFLEVGHPILVFLLEVFEDEFLHLRKTVQFSSGAGLDAHLRVRRLSLLLCQCREGERGQQREGEEPHPKVMFRDELIKRSKRRHGALAHLLVVLASRSRLRDKHLCNTGTNN